MLATSPRFQTNEGLRWEMRWHFVFMVFFHCLWVWKGMTDEKGGQMQVNGSIDLDGAHGTISVFDLE